MKVAEIRSKIKEVISNVADIPVEMIGDRASFREELNLDSGSLLKIGLDVDYGFKLGLPEERWRRIDTVEQAVALVANRLR